VVLGIILEQQFVLNAVRKYFHSNNKEQIMSTINQSKDLSAQLEQATQRAITYEEAFLQERRRGDAITLENADLRVKSEISYRKLQATIKTLSEENEALKTEIDKLKNK
jgi:cell division protein FtsB